LCETKPIPGGGASCTNKANWPAVEMAHRSTIPSFQHSKPVPAPEDPLCETKPIGSLGESQVPGGAEVTSNAPPGGVGRPKPKEALPDGPLCRPAGNSLVAWPGRRQKESPG
jgi:hypothetical protein